VNIRHAGLDVVAELENAIALGQFDSAQFTRPFLNILEEMAMDLAKMGEVKIAVRTTLHDPQRDKPALSLVEVRSACYAELVTENLGSGIEIGIINHSAARGRP
jgi:hypothetical protein